MTSITPQRFDYTAAPDIPGLQTGMPVLPITLSYQKRSLMVEGLVDSGSTVNVLPYDIGLQLGLDWETQRVPVPLRGNLQNAPACGVVLTGQVNPFPELPLVFVWTQTPRPQSRLLLGQMNFFQHFDVWFSGTQQTLLDNLSVGTREDLAQVCIFDEVAVSERIDSPGVKLIVLRSQQTRW